MSADLQSHQQRVVAEKAELDERLAKLLAFFPTPVFAGLPEAERARLRSQARFMDGYSAALGERIEAFRAPAQPEGKRYTRFDVHTHVVSDNAVDTASTFFCA